MGVKGLWKLLESAGNPIPVEKLENKVLSIDVSIWLYQIIKGVQESEHSTTSNKHLMIMFHRICKLLFYGIKPVFVFDGGVPELKKLTISQRQAQKTRAKKSTGKTKEKMLKNMLEQAALKTILNTGSTPTEDEVIIKTINSLNKGEENDLFELPKLPENIELDNTGTKEKDQMYLKPSKKETENILLLAIQNQENDILYTNSVDDKAKVSPAKLNTFSSLQIGELLNGYAEDQKRVLEKKNRQKAKREMTFNELEMFMNDNSETVEKIEEFSQKIDSDHDTVYYYESDIHKTAKSNNSKDNKKSTIMEPSKLEKSFITESNNLNEKVPIGSPTLTEDIDEDIFKVLAGDESLEEDRLAWLIFNENKKASKRRSSEFELPNSKCLKTDSSSEIIKSEEEDDNYVMNEKTPFKKHSSKSIFITEDDKSNEMLLDNFNDEDYLSWVSHSKDEPSKVQLEKTESSINYLDVPSTSKSFLTVKNDSSTNKPDVHQENINKSLYFLPTSDETEENDVFYNTSPLMESDRSNGSLSENSLDFSPDSLSNDAVEDKQNQQEHTVTVQNFKKELDTIKKKKTELIKAMKLKLSGKIDMYSQKLPEPDNQISSLDEQHLLSIQDTLVKRQNDLASLHKSSDKLASSVTQKITSDMKNLLKLFGIPYITAPMEAEAQCVFLEKIGHTDGTITDDSDVWLFGANVVYKDFFDSKKFVKQFKSIDIKQKFALSQNSFIQLAFLVGSDYTNGIDGIGPVSAIEMLSFFESKNKSTNIEDKLLKIKEVANSKSEVYNDIPFFKKLKSTKIGNDFPNKAVINCYLNPIVNESNEKFKWGTPQVDSIIQFAQTNFDWDVFKTKSTLAPVLKKVSERTTQTSLDSYMKTIPKLSNTNVGMSKRVGLAVKRLQNDGSSVELNKPKKSTSNSSSDLVDTKCKKTN